MLMLACARWRDVCGWQISHHGLTDAEFTRCLENEVDIDDFVRSKKNRADKAQVGYRVLSFVIVCSAYVCSAYVGVRFLTAAQNLCAVASVLPSIHLPVDV